MDRDQARRTGVRVQLGIVQMLYDLGYRVDGTVPGLWGQLSYYGFGDFAPGLGGKHAS